MTDEQINTILARKKDDILPVLHTHMPKGPYPYQSKHTGEWGDLYLWDDNCDMLYKKLEGPFLYQSTELKFANLDVEFLDNAVSREQRKPVPLAKVRMLFRHPLFNKIDKDVRLTAGEVRYYDAGEVQQAIYDEKKNRESYIQHVRKLTGVAGGPAQLSAFDTLTQVAAAAPRRSFRLRGPPKHFPLLGTFVSTSPSASPKKQVGPKPKRPVKRQLDFVGNQQQQPDAKKVKVKNPAANAVVDVDAKVKEHVFKLLRQERNLMKMAKDWSKYFAQGPPKAAMVVFKALGPRSRIAMAREAMEHVAPEQLLFLAKKFHKQAVQFTKVQMIGWGPTVGTGPADNVDPAPADDAGPADVNAGPAENVDPAVDAGPADVNVGPSVKVDPADDAGPIADVNVGPSAKVVNLVEVDEDDAEPIADADPANNMGPNEVTPAPSDGFPAHWLRSSRSASGFKGVIKCRRKGKPWRAKLNGHTLGRYATQREACEAVYLAEKSAAAQVPKLVSQTALCDFLDTYDN